MVDIDDIHPVTDFNRNTKEYIERLKATGKPEVLTVNGEAEVVVQSAAAYQELVDELDRLDYAESVRVLKERFDAVKAGEVGVPWDNVLDEMKNLIKWKSKG